MKCHTIYILTLAVIFQSCSNHNNPCVLIQNREEMRLQDSLTDGYLSSVIETAVENHVRKYLGFEKEQSFFDTAFLCDYPKNIKKFFIVNKEGFTFTLDAGNSTVKVLFHGEYYSTVDVSRYNCKNLCCLYRNRVLLYDNKGSVSTDNEIILTVKQGLKRLERTFVEKGYLCDSIMDVDIKYPKSLFCDISGSSNPSFRCFFDTISLQKNDYIKNVIDTLNLYRARYGLSRIVSNVIVLHPAK